MASIPAGTYEPVDVRLMLVPPQATTFARELVQEKKEILGESWKLWSVEVSNGKFIRLFKIPFLDVIQPGEVPMGE